MPSVATSPKEALLSQSITVILANHGMHRLCVRGLVMLFFVRATPHSDSKWCRCLDGRMCEPSASMVGRWGKWWEKLSGDNANKSILSSNLTFCYWNQPSKLVLSLKAFRQACSSSSDASVKCRFALFTTLSIWNSMRWLACHYQSRDWFSRLTLFNNNTFCILFLHPGLWLARRAFIPFQCHGCAGSSVVSVIMSNFISCIGETGEVRGHSDARWQPD